MGHDAAVIIMLACLPIDWASQASSDLYNRPCMYLAAKAMHLGKQSKEASKHPEVAFVHTG
jgi:hypothetical protein